MKYFYLFIIFAILSCNVKNPNERKLDDILAEGEVIVLVKKSAGDIYEKTNNFLPLPVNIGVIKNSNERAILISSRIKENKKIASKIIGKLLFRGDSISSILVCFPLDDNLKVLKSENFTDFSTIDFQAKHIIESYFRGYLGVENDAFYKWESIN